MNAIVPNGHGPHAVGARCVTVKGPEGIELPTEVWYPCDADEAVDPHAYLPGLHGHARAAGPAEGKRWPVLVFSHGHTGIRFQSISLAESLASRGFVVAAPDHIGNTFVDTMHDLMGPIAMRRPADLAAVFDGLLADPVLSGALDPDAGYAAMGHSFGGWTALLGAGARVDRQFLASACGSRRHFLCQLLEMGTERFVELADPRVWATVALAPTGYATLGPEGLASLGVPALVMGGTEDEITPWDEQQRPSWEALRCDARFGALVQGASHYTFSDAARLAPIDPYTRGSLPLAEAHPLITGIVAAFLDRTLEREGAGAWPHADPRVAWLVP